MKSLKLKDHPGGNAVDYCDKILVDVERLDSAWAFNPEETSDSRFHLWATQKYKEVMEFVKKPFVCDKDIMKTDDIINYGYFVQEALREYRNIVESNQWEPTDGKKLSKF